MRVTWNIVAKDFLRMRAVILAWFGLMAAKILLYAFVSGAIGRPSESWLLLLGQGPAVAVRACLDPLIAFVLTGWMVHEDPLVGADAFWVTRPISGARLLGAKLLGAALFLVLFPILLNVPWWLACGFGAGEIGRAMVPMAAEYSLVVIVGIGVASATTSFPRYFLWTIAGFAGLFAIHLMAAELAGAWLGTLSDEAIGTAIALTRFLILLACAVLVCAQIGAFQYLSRHFQRSLPVLVALTVMASAIGFTSRLNIFPHLGWDSTAMSFSRASVDPNSDVGVRAPTDPAQQPHFDGYMVVPLTLTHLPPDSTAVWTTQGEWISGGRSIWKAGGWDNRKQDELHQERMHSLAGFTPSAADFNSETTFQFPQPLAQRFAGKPLSFRSKVTVYLMKGSVAADEPVQEQSFRATSSSFSVNDLVRTEHSVAATVTDRFERTSLLALFGFVLPRSVSWSLVNRTKGDMRIGKQKLGSSPLGIQLNMVSVVSERIVFADIPSSSWLGGARLVAFEFNADHRVERSLDIEPFEYTYVSPEESRYRFKKAH
jgi:hypothetical protein